MQVQFTVATQCSVLSEPQLSAGIAPNVSCQHDEPADIALIEEDAAPPPPTLAAAKPAPAVPAATSFKQQFWVVTF